MKDYAILYVEDETNVRQNYTHYFESFFTYVHAVSSSEKAREIIDENEIDILLIDISLPGKNGLDFVKELRQDNQNLRIIVLTAHSDLHWLLQATQLKLTDYLLKPVERSKLKDALQKAIYELEHYEVISKEVIKLGNGLVWDIKENLFIGEDIHLTLNEQLFISILTEQMKTPVHGDDICQDIWGVGVNEKASSLKTLVKNLRKKLPENTIENVYGQGYRLCF